jgi:hypothetical protein
MVEGFDKEVLIFGARNGQTEEKGWSKKKNKSYKKTIKSIYW